METKNETMDSTSEPVQKFEIESEKQLVVLSLKNCIQKWLRMMMHLHRENLNKFRILSMSKVEQTMLKNVILQMMSKMHLT